MEPEEYTNTYDLIWKDWANDLEILSPYMRLQLFERIEAAYCIYCGDKQLERGMPCQCYYE